MWHKRQEDREHSSDQSFLLGQMQGMLSSLNDTVIKEFREVKKELAEVRDYVRKVESTAHDGSVMSKKNSEDIERLQQAVLDVQKKVTHIDSEATSRAWMFPYLQRAMPVIMILTLALGGVATWMVVQTIDNMSTVIAKESVKKE